MIFDTEKKQQICLYLLEKIEQKSPNLTKKVAEEFSITQNTVYTYLSELEKEGAIRKIQRGEYELITKKYIIELKRSLGELKYENTVISKYLDEYLKELPSNVYSIWYYVLGEMINNVIDHSGCENLIIIVEKNILNTIITLEDDGVGIFNKIKAFFDFETDDDVICELFKGKLTTDKENHSGEGIFFSSRVMDYFEIISGNSKYIYDNVAGDSSSDTNSSGTKFVMKLSNNSKKTTREVFDYFADIDEGFIKTNVPLKNVFDGNLVSRSQAKRISNRLEDFKTVNLDFKDVEWIGQGFADQLFRVFKDSHPEITLSATNMNEDVLRMYQHVLNRSKELKD